MWDSPGTKVYHHTVITNGNVVKSIEFRFVTAGAEAANNLADAPIATRNGGTYAASGNYLTATSSMFADAVGGDLHLVDSAETRTHVIDRGVALGGAVPDDFDGDARPMGAAPDIGADEFRGTAPTTPPS